MTVEGYVRLREVARLLGVTEQRVHQLRHRDDFPGPALIEIDRAMWDRDAIRRWAETHPCGDRRWGPR